MPVSTRTGTGKVKRQSYSYAALKLQGEAVKEVAPSSKPASKRARKASCGESSSQANQPRKAKRGANSKSEAKVKAWSPPPEFDAEVLVEELKKDQEKFTPPEVDVCEAVNFMPDVVFGEQTEEGMSRIQVADLEIEKWEMVKAAHEKHLPRVVPMINETLRKLRERREMIEENEENTRVFDEEAAKKEIKDRIEVLHEALEESEFDAERENIRGAIEAYQSGEVGYAKHYTLIWKGRVVDTADTYADFTRDRMERLDRYAKEYGPHWLWWERGLKIHPNSAPRASLCLTLGRNISVTGLGQYYIHQCFWKRHGWVHRMPTLIGAAPDAVPLEDSQGFFTSPEGLAYCQNEGPKLVFQSLLDSGATYPSLHPDDFISLGIESNNYSAQSIESFVTANGKIRSRIYEMSVAVCDHECRSLVDDDDPVWPSCGRYLGGLCPVAQCIMPAEQSLNPDGYQPNYRLSGFLPFLACYTTIAPTMNTIFMGEDRNDVLGLHKMPGQRRWDISLPSQQGALVALGPDYFDNPKITFNHRNGYIIDQDRDDETHNATLTFAAGTPDVHHLQSHPGKEAAAAAAARTAANMAILEAALVGPS